MLKGALTFITMLLIAVIYTYLIGAQTSLLLVYMFVLCVPVSVFLTLPMRKCFEVSIEIPSIEVEQDGVVKVNLVVRNKSVLPVPFVGVSFLQADNLILQDSAEKCLSFSPRETKYITARFNASHRGIADIGLKKLFLMDYLGFFSFSLLKGLEPHQYTGRITVLPRITTIKPSSKIMQGTGTRESMTNEAESVSAVSNCFTGEPGHEFREFQAGDPLHQVHWKLSAKTDRLMVRKSEIGGASKISFILDPFVTAGIQSFRKNKKATAIEDASPKSRDAEEKLLETLLSVTNMVIQLGRFAEVWLYSQEQWQVKSITQRKELMELQRCLAQYHFINSNAENNSNRLPLLSMLQQQKMNRNYKGGEAILFTAGYDHHLEGLLESGELKGITLRVIQIKEKLPGSQQNIESVNPSIKEVLWVLTTDDNLSDAVI